MILQDLSTYYDILAKDGSAGIPLWGYSKADVSFAVVISEAGEISGIVDLRVGEKKPRPQPMNVPLQASRSGKNPPPYLVCDKPKYIFGVEKLKKEDFNKKFKQSAEGKLAEYTILEETDEEVILVSPSSREYFEAFKALQRDVLKDVDDTGVRGFLRFLDSWNPEKFLEYPKTKEYKDELLSGGVCVFRCGENFLHENNKVKIAWENYYDEDPGEKTVGQCLITGEMEPIARVHQQIKGVIGAQSSGAPVVSFNDDAFCSYGKSQSFNAQTGYTGAFKYTTSLNLLLKDERHRSRIADTTVVFWAETNKATNDDLIKDLFNSWNTVSDEADREAADSKIRQISNVMEKVRQGKHIDEADIDGADVPFRILGLSPNKGRIAIRFWYADSYGHFIERIAQHYLDTEIVRGKLDSAYPPYVSLYSLLSETVAREEDKKRIQALFDGLIVNSIFNNKAYPTSLCSAMLSRIKVEGITSLNCVRAGFIKGYLRRLSRAGLCNIEEGLITVNLNEESANVPYRLGRLFAVLVKVQIAANKTINTTVGDRYFSSAATMPAAVFPTLLKLSQHHLSQLDTLNKSGLKVWYSKLMDEILLEVNEFPTFFNLEEQGMFMLGYYHQNNDLFTKKEADIDADSVEDLDKEASVNE